MTRWLGNFTLKPDLEVSGELVFAGAGTALSLHSQHQFEIDEIPSRYITGVLQDTTKVSLLDCVPINWSSHSNLSTHKYTEGKLFPHFVIRGNRYLRPAVRSILSVEFTIDDAPTLFCDFDAFGMVRPTEFSMVLKKKFIERHFKYEARGDLFYFTGKLGIISVPTCWGVVSARHAPTVSSHFGAPSHIRDKIITSITFAELVDFETAIYRVFTLIQFFGLVIGRPQRMKGLALHSERLGTDSDPLSVYCSYGPTRNTRYGLKRPHPADKLLDPVGRSEEFARVLQDWLSRQASWRDARSRFSPSFQKWRQNDINKLIASANMFDILPASSVPPAAQLSSALQQAKLDARAIFKTLPDSPERSSMLNAIGRIGKLTLKQKVRFRAQPIIDACPENFPHLIVILDQAINCRNFFVHGGIPPFSYSENKFAITFFIDTLLFVFGVSDLIQAGWDFRSWVHSLSAKSHPFGAYKADYSQVMEQLMTLIVKAGDTVDDPVIQ